MAQFVVFYSWQSDAPNSTNRSFIERALEAAAKSLREDRSVTIEPVVDRDTAGVPGAPNIADTIFAKIDQASVFVADVSIVVRAENRSAPNPNVLVELGYALKTLGWGRVVMVMNTAFGKPADLPFDLRTRRILSYRAQEGEADRSAARKLLEKILAKAIGEIPPREAAEEETPQSRVERLKEWIFDPNKQIQVHDLLLQTTGTLQSALNDAPEDLNTPFSSEELRARVQRYEGLSSVLEGLFATGCYWGAPNLNAEWPRLLDRASTQPDIQGTYLDVWDRLRSYPALRLLYTGGIAALRRGKYDTLRALLYEPRRRTRGAQEPAVLSLNAPEVLPPDLRTASRGHGATPYAHECTPRTHDAL